MLTYEEALIIAKKVKPQINHCVEYTNAFSFDNDAGEDMDGGDEPVVVMKEDGRIMRMLEYALTPDKDYVRDFEV